MFQMIKRRKEENKNIHENENYETSISIRPSTKVVRVQKFLHSSGEKLQLFRKSFSKLLVEKYTHFSFNNPLLRTDPPSGILKKKKTKSNLGPFSATQGNNVCQGSNN